MITDPIGDARPSQLDARSREDPLNGGHTVDDPSADIVSADWAIADGELQASVTVVSLEGDGVTAAPFASVRFGDRTLVITTTWGWRADVPLEGQLQIEEIADKNRFVESNYHLGSVDVAEGRLVYRFPLTVVNDLLVQSRAEDHDPLNDDGPLMATGAIVSDPTVSNAGCDLDWTLFGVTMPGSSASSATRGCASDKAEAQGSWIL